MPMKKSHQPKIPTTRKFSQQFLKKYSNQGTKEIYADTLKAWFVDLGDKADLSVDRLTPADYWDFEERGLPDLGAATRKRNFQGVRGVIKLAIKHNHLAPDFLKLGATPAKRGSSKPVRRKKPTVTTPAAPASTATGKAAATAAVPQAATPALSATGLPGAGHTVVTTVAPQNAGYAVCARCIQFGRCPHGTPGYIRPPKKGTQCPITQLRRTDFYKHMNPKAPGGQKVKCTKGRKKMYGDHWCYFCSTGITEHMIATGAAPGPLDPLPPNSSGIPGPATPGKQP